MFFNEITHISYYVPIKTFKRQDVDQKQIKATVDVLRRFTH